MKNKLRFNSILISVLTALLTFCVYHFDPKFILSNFEDKSLDLRFTIRGPVAPKAPLLVARIDDDSLQAIGKWPWPRKVHARLIDLCRRHGALAVVYDVLFLEKDQYDPSNDRALAQAMRRNGKVVSAYDLRYDPNETAVGTTTITGQVFMEPPIPSVEMNSARIGLVNNEPDPDGALRRATVQFNYEGDLHYPLGIETVSLIKGVEPEELLKDLPVFDGWAISNNVPTQDVLLNWRGGEEAFDFRSISYLLDKGTPDEWLGSVLKGKIILIGSTALATFDHYPTPFSSSTGGLYVHANVIDNLWGGDFLKPLPGILTVALIFVFALLAGVLVPRVQATASAAVFLSLAGLLWAAGYFLMAKKLYYLELVAPTLSLLGSYIGVFFYRFIIEQREKAGIKKAFGVYVNPHVVDAIAKNPDALKLGGEMREMTVMFSDVAGFTTISEKLSPEELVHLLNIYLTAMTDTIMKLDGTVDKYEGDAIMAFWGAPLAQPQHAKQACLAVLENRDRLRELNVELSKKGLQQLNARCGLNTGPMNVGNMGSSQKFNYTVMGDAVNLASRLEGANKQYGSNLMVSESTYAAAKDFIEVRELDLLRVKGKNVPITVYELVSRKGELTDVQKRGFEKYSEALALYRKRDFKSALKLFEQTQEIINNDGPSATYAGRCKNFIEAPPPKDWDGVFVMTTK